VPARGCARKRPGGSGPQEKEETGRAGVRRGDLRESDALAHDADIVLLLWREDAQVREVQPSECAEINVRVAKHRNGPTGRATLAFRWACARFENLAV
jgi:replicative DNA helicase